MRLFTSFAGVPLGKHSVWHDEGVILVLGDEHIGHRLDSFLDQAPTVVFGLVIKEWSLLDLAMAGVPSRK